MTGCSSANERQKAVLKYGKDSVEIDLSGAASVDWLYGRETPQIADLKEAFRNAVEEGAIGQPLKKRLHREDGVTIIISDITRFWMRQDMITELLVRYLESECGIPDEQIVVLVALGTHRPMTQEELRKIASPYVHDRVRVVNHDCDAVNLVRLGMTSFGNAVEVNPLAVGRRVITVGGTVHHLMAGYGGGRKSILPGISSRAAIRRNHSMALDPEKPCSSERVGSGKLGINPIHEEMEETAHMVSPVFGVNIVVNTEGKHSGLFCGDFDAAWKASCAFCQHCYAQKIEREADVVIASCGGYPKDMNLYQGVKSVLNGVRALKPGGTFVFLCECEEGGGAPDFFDWTKPLAEGRLDAALRGDFTIAGYIFYASCEAITRAGQFLMLSRIDPELVKNMGIQACHTLDDLLKNMDFTGKHIAVIPNGGCVLPQSPESFVRLNAEVAMD